MSTVAAGISVLPCMPPMFLPHITIKKKQSPKKRRQLKAQACVSSAEINEFVPLSMQHFLPATGMVDLQTDAFEKDIVTWHIDRIVLCRAQVVEREIER